MSGATVSLIEDRPDQTEKVVQISGTPEQSERAQSLLQGFILSSNLLFSLSLSLLLNFFLLSSYNSPSYFFHLLVNLLSSNVTSPGPLSCQHKMTFHQANRAMAALKLTASGGAITFSTSNPQLVLPFTVRRTKRNGSLILM